MATLTQIATAFTLVATDATQASTDTSDATGATTQTDLVKLNTDLQTATDLLTEYIQGLQDIDTGVDGESTSVIDASADQSNESNSD